MPLIIVTGVSCLTYLYKSSTSLLFILIQPAEAFDPIECGLLVPCIPYVPQGTFIPIHLVPNPPPHLALLITFHVPIGLGVLSLPLAIGYFFTNSFPFIR